MYKGSYPEFLFSLFCRMLRTKRGELARRNNSFSLGKVEQNVKVSVLRLWLLQTKSLPHPTQSQPPLTTLAQTLGSLLPTGSASLAICRLLMPVKYLGTLAVLYANTGVSNYRDIVRTRLGLQIHSY